MPQDLLRVSLQSRIQCRWAELQKGRQNAESSAEGSSDSGSGVEKEHVWAVSGFKTMLQLWVVESTLFESVLHKKAKGEGNLLGKGHPMEKGIGKRRKDGEKGWKGGMGGVVGGKGDGWRLLALWRKSFFERMPKRRREGIPIVGMVPT